MLFREHAGNRLSLLGYELQPLALAERRQLTLGLVLDLLLAFLLLREKLLVDPFHIDDRMARKLHHGAG